MPDEREQAKKLAERWQRRRIKVLGESAQCSRRDLWEIDFEAYRQVALLEFLKIVRVPLANWELKLDERKDRTNDYIWTQRTIYSSHFQGIDLKLTREESGIKGGHFKGCDSLGVLPQRIPAEYNLYLLLKVGEPINENFSERYRGIRELFDNIDRNHKKSHK